MKKILLSLLLVVLLSFLVSACSDAGSWFQGQATAEPGTLLLGDDFSVHPNGWGTMGRSGGEIGFEYEGLLISVNLPNYMFWTVRGDKFTDTRIEVDAVLLDGPPDDNFGVICRFQDNYNYYGFVITHDGYYGIYKMLDGKMILSSVNGDLQYSDAIRQGGVVNHIRAVCQGSRLSLIVNDTLLAEVEDISFIDGQVGLVASAYEYPGVKILFDNLLVYQP